MSWKRHVSAVPQGAKLRAAIEKLHSNLDLQATGGSTNKFASYLPEVYAGQPNRIERYGQFENMDRDPEVAGSVDTIADFGTQTEEQEETCFALKLSSNSTDAEIEILNTALKKWTKLNKFKQILWRIFRSTIMYGDQFFVRDPETFEWFWINHEQIESIIVNEADGKKTDQYIIKDMDLNIQTLVATLPAKNTNRGFSGWAGTSKNAGPVSGLGTQGMPSGTNRFEVGQYSSVIDAEHVIHLSMTEGMDANWPFGNSILESIFKPFKQKELLEDSIIIYRVQRAPERRVFYIDVGDAPPHKAMEFVNRIKNEIHQRRIPTQSGGGTCLALDTKIPLLDGRTLELNQLIEEYKQGKENWVYSCDSNTGEMVPGPITWAGITRKNTNVLKLTLDNGEEIICTPDHKFPIKGKEKTEAKDIVVNEDSLISFNKRLYSINEREDLEKLTPQYEQVFDHKTKTWGFTHRTVANFFKERNNHNELVYDKSKLLEKSIKRVIHHKDFNKYNNNPENLWFMDPVDHFTLHSKEGKKYWSSISKEERDRISKIKSEKNKLSWERYKNNPELYNKRMLNHSIARKKAITNNPKLKEQVIRNLTAMDKPFPNQKLVFSDNMMEMLKKFTTTEYNGDICDGLSNNAEFMEEYKKINKPIKGLHNQLNYEHFSPGTLRKMVNNYGYKHWRDFLKIANLKVKKPSRKINWSEIQLNILVNQIKMGVNNKSSSVRELNNNLEFMKIFYDLNVNIKGNAKKDNFTNNTLGVMIKHFGYKSWSDFKNKIGVYNHKVVKIEYLPEKIDTGTITVDGKEKYHNFHTFALDSGVYIFNSMMDAAYNPLSIIEDYFFPNNSEGRGSKVETLPGGDNLGEIDDLKYFNNKLLRGLRVPSSYLPYGPEDGSQSYNDGRVGTAYMQEFRFAKYVKRLQNLLNPVFDREFKIFLRHRGINIDAGAFDLELHEPQNFSKFRQMEIDSAQIAVWQPLSEIPYLSKRWVLQRYLNLNEEELVENERMWKEENPDLVKSSTSGGIGEAPGSGLSAVGINPEDGEEDFDAGEIGDETGLEGESGEDSPISGTEEEIPVEDLEI